MHQAHYILLRFSNSWNKIKSGFLLSRIPPPSGDRMLCFPKVKREQRWSCYHCFSVFSLCLCGFLIIFFFCMLCVNFPFFFHSCFNDWELKLQFWCLHSCSLVLHPPTCTLFVLQHQSPKEQSRLWYSASAIELGIEFTAPHLQGFVPAQIHQLGPRPVTSLFFPLPESYSNCSHKHKL